MIKKLFFIILISVSTLILFACDEKADFYGSWIARSTYDTNSEAISKLDKISDQRIFHLTPEATFSEIRGYRAPSTGTFSVNKVLNGKWEISFSYDNKLYVEGWTLKRDNQTYLIVTINDRNFAFSKENNPQLDHFPSDDTFDFQAIQIGDLYNDGEFHIIDNAQSEYYNFITLIYGEGNIIDFTKYNVVVIYMDIISFTPQYIINSVEKIDNHFTIKVEDELHSIEWSWGLSGWLFSFQSPKSYTSGITGGTTLKV
ncbi:MAG: hypothetical protein LBV55_00930 [Acholeplasmatales bacterium]|nr:hypothetical protein [Acholeplasmatales bacterium]